MAVFQLSIRIDEPVIIRSWRPEKGTPGRKESLDYWESHIGGKLNSLREVIAAFEQSFVGRKEQTLLCRIPAAKKDADVLGLLKAWKCFLPSGGQDSWLGTPRQIFEPILEDLAPLQPPVPQILTAVREMSIVGYKPSFRQECSVQKCWLVINIEWDSSVVVCLGVCFAGGL